jgi:hypothetical protein
MSPRAGRGPRAPRPPQGGARPADIDLRIERIVLDGLPVSWQDRAAVAGVVESELQRLLVAAGWDGRGGPMAVPSLRSEAIHWTPSEGVGRLGARVAQAVYGTLAGSIDPRGAQP